MLGLNISVRIFGRLGVFYTVGSGVVSGVRFFNGNILLLKLLTTFPLALRRNLTFWRKGFSKLAFHLLFVSLNSLSSLLCSLSLSSIDKIHVCIFLENIIGSEALLKLWFFHFLVYKLAYLILYYLVIDWSLLAYEESNHSHNFVLICS